MNQGIVYLDGIFYPMQSGGSGGGKTLFINVSGVGIFNVQQDSLGLFITIAGARFNVVNQSLPQDGTVIVKSPSRVGNSPFVDSTALATYMNSNSIHIIDFDHGLSFIIDTDPSFNAIGCFLVAGGAYGASDRIGFVLPNNVGVVTQFFAESSFGGSLFEFFIKGGDLIFVLQEAATPFAQFTRQGGVNLLKISGGNAGSSKIEFGGAPLGFFNHAVAIQQVSGADLTNNVTVGGVDDTIANFADLAVYANSAATIRNDIYQLARKLKQINDGLRAYGLFT